MFKNLVITAFTLLSLGGLLSLGVYYFSQPVEKTVLQILVPTDNPLRRIKIYEQFMPTQLLRLTDPIRLTRVVVPIYTGTTKEYLVVSLTRNGRLLYRWRLDPDQWEENTTIDVDLGLPYPLLIDGDLELAFAAPTLDAKHREEASHVLFESADPYYPDGHFRIAGEDKQGDLGLSLIALQSRWEVEKGAWLKDPLQYIARTSLWLLFAPLLFSLSNLWHWRRQ